MIFKVFRLIGLCVWIPFFMALGACGGDGSGEAAASKSIIEDIVYKTTAEGELKLDIYKPLSVGNGLSPAIIFVHGGGWVNGTKSILSDNYRVDVNEVLRNRGYTVIRIDYRLANGQILMDDLVADVKDAIRWTRKEAINYGIDSNNIGIWGSSAGAHLALMAGYAPDALFPGDNSLSAYLASVDYVVDNFGPTDLQSMYHMEKTFDDFMAMSQADPTNFRNTVETIKMVTGIDPTLNFVQTQLDLLEYSPAKYISIDTPPTLIMHGDADLVVDIYQSVLLHEKLDSRSLENNFLEYSNVRHGFANTSSTQRKNITETIVDFVVTQKD